MDASEILLCAQVNFENTEKMMPVLKQHPIFQMAMEQLGNGIKKLEEEEPKDGPFQGT